MVSTFHGVAMLVLVAFGMTACTRVTALSLHPENPHYFLFRGKPTILVTSAEHYGAVINSDFDFREYLETLSADRMNHTRIWVGAYCEPKGALNIDRNTLAPEPGRFSCPWSRSDEPGYINGGTKFDLTRWNNAYWARLKEFMSEASRRGIVVEVNLFCPFYTDEIWAMSPMHPSNNVNCLGGTARDQAYTLDRHGGLLQIQEALARKVVTELQGFDNLFFEVMNEPYVCKVPVDWQQHMIAVIDETIKQTGARKLISMNIANEKEKVERANPAVSILNFHYAWPPDAVAMNYGLNVVVGENETGGIGGGDFRYRREGWAFILAGGGLYNNLDYSFTVGHEDGTFTYPPTQPGGGSAALRRQLGILVSFINAFDFIRMAPLPDRTGGQLPEGTRAFILVEPGRQYAAYICDTGKEAPKTTRVASIAIELPAGRYTLEWIDPVTGQAASSATIQHAGGERLFESPAFLADIAMRLVRR